jgi:hypothetical protein
LAYVFVGAGTACIFFGAAGIIDGAGAGAGTIEEGYIAGAIAADGIASASDSANNLTLSLSVTHFFNDDRSFASIASGLRENISAKCAQSAYTTLVGKEIRHVSIIIRIIAVSSLNVLYSTA